MEDIPISGAVVQEAKVPEIYETILESTKKKTIKLPLTEKHKMVIDEVWKAKKLDSLAESNISAKSRYQLLILNDYNKYFKPREEDQMLKHELGRVQPTLSNNQNFLEIVHYGSTG